MYFTELPSLNSIEAIMKQPPGVSQRGGGRKRSSHKYNKKDCDCRFCLEHSNDGCTADITASLRSQVVSRRPAKRLRSSPRPSVPERC